MVEEDLVEAVEEVVEEVVMEVEAPMGHATIMVLPPSWSVSSPFEYIIHTVCHQTLTLVIACGAFVHPCEGEMVCKATLNAQVPYFNAPIFLENKTQIGKVDEIFGPLNEYVKIIIIK